MSPADTSHGSLFTVSLCPTLAPITLIPPTDWASESDTWVMEKREAGVGDTVKREKGAAGVGGAAKTGSAGSSSVTKAALPGTSGKPPSHSNLLPASQTTESLLLCDQFPSPPQLPLKMIPHFEARPPVKVMSGSDP